MNIEKIADQLFGSANDCIALIKQQKWKEDHLYKPQPLFQQ